MRLVIQMGYTFYTLPAGVDGTMLIHAIGQLQQVERKYISGVGNSDVFTPVEKPGEIEIKYVPDTAFEGEKHESAMASLVRESEKKFTDERTKVWTLEQKLKKYEQKYGAEV